MSLQIRRLSTGAVFLAAVAGSVATSKTEQPLNVMDSVDDVPFSLTAANPKASFTVTITGNRAAFPGSTAAFQGLLGVAVHFPNADGGSASQQGTLAVAYETQGKTTQLGQGPALALTTTPANFDVSAACTADPCQRTGTLTFTLLDGGPLSGLFDVDASIIGSTGSKPPANATLKVDVARVP